MCRRMEMRNTMARLGLPWWGGQKTGLGRYTKATAGTWSTEGRDQIWLLGGWVLWMR